MRLGRVAGIFLLGVGLWQIADGLAIPAKARLAQVLLDRAWQRARAGETGVKPWPWADTWPVARLSAPRLGTHAYVLADASGRSLAFGPGHVAGTAPPGAAGNSVIAAHRDTHFRFLRDVALGDAIVLDTPDGAQRLYRVADLRVVDSRRARVAPSDTATLTLVTCYPFDAVLPGGPLRYVVTAHAQ